MIFGIFKHICSCVAQTKSTAAATDLTTKKTEDYIFHGKSGNLLLLVRSCALQYTVAFVTLYVIVCICCFFTFIIIIFISAVYATAGRWLQQLTPCTSILSQPHPLTAINFLDVVSPSPFGSPSYSFSFSGCPF